jgi:hypothetical protein
MWRIRVGVGIGASGRPDINHAPKLLVRARVVDEHLHALYDAREALTIRKAPKDCAKLRKGLLKRQVRLQSVVRLGSLGCNVLCMDRVLFDVIE